MHEFGFGGTKGINLALKCVWCIRFQIYGVIVFSPRWGELFCFFFGEDPPMSLIFDRKVLRLQGAMWLMSLSGSGFGM
jgi:hypothetical protein